MSPRPAQTRDRAEYSVLDAALSYAALGWPVFRLNGKSKTPPKGSRGFKDAATDEQVVRAAFREHPRSNLGVDLGGARLLLVDIDPRNGGQESFDALVEEHGALPPTPRALTGGGGWHYFLSNPNGLRSKTIAPGIDVKGHGGYALLPPSKHPSGERYKWESSPDEVATADPPEWLLERLTGSSERDAAWKPSGARPSAEVLAWLRDGDWPIGEQESRIPRVARALLDWGKSEEEATDQILDALDRSDQQQTDPWTRERVAYHVHSIATSPPPAKRRRATEVMFDEKGRPLLPELPDREDIAGLCTWLTAVFCLDTDHPVTGATFQGPKGPGGQVTVARADAPPIVFETASRINTPQTLATTLTWYMEHGDQRPHSYKQDQCTEIASVVAALCDFSRAISQEQEAAGILGTFTQAATPIEGFTTYGSTVDRYRAATALRGEYKEGERRVILSRDPRYLIDDNTGELVIRVSDLAEAARRHIGSSLRHGWLDSVMEAFEWSRVDLQGYAESGRRGRSIGHVRVTVYRGMFPVIEVNT